MRQRLQRAYARHGIAGLFRLMPKNAGFALSYFAPHRRRLRRAIGEFDRRFGVDTGGFEWISSFDAAAETAAHANNYAPVLKVEPYLRSLGIAFDQYTFIDLGCGKGRALLMASDFPFTEIIGVEYIAELVATARRNLERYSSTAQQCHSIRVVECDAAFFEPPAAPIVLFLYNPFDAVVLKQVLDRLGSSQSHPALRHYMIYCDPEHRSVIDRDPNWELVADHLSWVVYRSSVAAGLDPCAARDPAMADVCMIAPMEPIHE